MKEKTKENIIFLLIMCVLFATAFFLISLGLMAFRSSFTSQIPESDLHKKWCLSWRGDMPAEIWKECDVLFTSGGYTIPESAKDFKPNI